MGWVWGVERGGQGAGAVVVVVMVAMAAAVAVAVKDKYDKFVVLRRKE